MDAPKIICRHVFVCFAAHGPFGILNVLRQDMLAHVLLHSLIELFSITMC